MSARSRQSGARLGPATSRAGRAQQRRAERSSRPSPLRPTDSNIARPFALIVGIVYVAVGVAGFVVTGFSGFVTSHGHLLFGFEVNIFHNLVHLVIGGGFIIASRLPDSTATQGILIGGGAVYLVAALLGFLMKLPIIAITSHAAPDNFLHLASGAAAVIAGLLATRQASKAYVG
ncbi:MAG: DUF4383 domain-containing protein [Solirubrobacteraceae bacterium]